MGHFLIAGFRRPVHNRIQQQWERKAHQKTIGEFRSGPPGSTWLAALADLCILPNMFSILMRHPPASMTMRASQRELWAQLPKPRLSLLTTCTRRKAAAALFA